MAHGYTSRRVWDPRSIARVSIDVHERCDDAAKVAGDAMADAIVHVFERRRAQTASGEDVFVTVALSGGSALMAWPHALAKLGDASTRIRLTWVDERCVPVSDASSNRGATHRLCDANVAEELPLWLDDESPPEAVARVRAGLKRWGGTLDVTLLGMGPDGHIASLFPNQDWQGDLVRFVDDSPKPPAERMTLTRDVLATAQTSILLATGQAKHVVLMRLLAGDTTLPAVGLPHLRLFTDLDLTSGSHT